MHYFFSKEIERPCEEEVFFKKKYIHVVDILYSSFPLKC